MLRIKRNGDENVGHPSTFGLMVETLGRTKVRSLDWRPVWLPVEAVLLIRQFAASISTLCVLGVCLVLHTHTHTNVCATYGDTSVSQSRIDVSK